MRKSKRREEAREIDVPLAIGSHRSCSLTSNSYPSPCACVSSAFLSMGSSSGDWAGSTPSFFGGVGDILSAGCWYGAYALASNSLASTSLETRSLGGRGCDRGVTRCLTGEWLAACSSVNAANVRGRWATAGAQGRASCERAGGGAGERRGAAVARCKGQAPSRGGQARPNRGSRRGRRGTVPCCATTAMELSRSAGPGSATACRCQRLAGGVEGVSRRILGAQRGVAVGNRSHAPCLGRKTFSSSDALGPMGVRGGRASALTRVERGARWMGVVRGRIEDEEER